MPEPLEYQRPGTEKVHGGMKGLIGCAMFVVGAAPLILMLPHPPWIGPFPLSGLIAAAAFITGLWLGIAAERDPVRTHEASRQAVAWNGVALVMIVLIWFAIQV